MVNGKSRSRVEVQVEAAVNSLADALREHVPPTLTWYEATAMYLKLRRNMKGLCQVLERLEQLQCGERGSQEGLAAPNP